MAAAAGSLSAAGQHVWEEHIIAEASPNAIYLQHTCSAVWLWSVCICELKPLIFSSAWQVGVANLFAAFIILTAVVVVYIMSRARPVYLLDFHVFKPRDDLKMPSATFLQHSRKCKVASGLCAGALALLQGRIAPKRMADASEAADTAGLYAREHHISGEDGGKGRPWRRDISARRYSCIKNTVVAVVTTCC